MPCLNQTHSHTWPTSGSLVIERCETICQFCDFMPSKNGTGNNNFAWFLRRHVMQKHRNDFPDLVVEKGW